MAELEACGMPGPDYIVRAPNSSMDAWLERPARYDDFARALHLLLMIHGGETPESVIEFTPHGCRHVQVTAGAQLAAQGVITNKSLESLGQWEPGSKMPARYDSAACVTELQTRKTITDVLKTGWRPAEDGNLPAPATPAMARTGAPGTPSNAMVAPQIQIAKVEREKSEEEMPRRATTIMALNTSRKRFHLVAPPAVTSVCTWWTCGTVEKPAWNAKFGVTTGGDKCRLCFGR